VKTIAKSRAIATIYPDLADRGHCGAQLAFPVLTSSPLSLRANSILVRRAWATSVVPPPCVASFTFSERRELIMRKYFALTLMAIGLTALGCEKSPQQRQADAVRDNTQNAADQTRDNTQHQADAVREAGNAADTNAEKQADAIESAGEKKADAIEAQGERKADAIEANK